MRVPKQAMSSPAELNKDESGPSSELQQPANRRRHGSRQSPATVTIVNLQRVITPRAWVFNGLQYA
jgi:hypothetical protein